MTVASRSRGPVDEAVSFGAVDGGTPAEVAAASEIVILCVPNSPEVVQVLDAMLESLAPGTIVVDCSTIDPDVERAQHERVAAAGARYLDAPVSGGTVGAKNGHAHAHGGRRRRHPRRGTPRPRPPGGARSCTWAARAWARW